MSVLQNPVAAAATAVAATIGIAVVLVKEIVLPTHTAAVAFEAAVTRKELTDNLEGARREYAASQASLTKEKSISQSLEVEVNKLREKIKELNKALFVSQQNNLFSKNNAYPAGLDQAKIGDRIASIEPAFPGILVKKERRSVSVEDGHDIFSTIHYGFDQDAKDPIIDSIQFWIPNYRRLRKSLPPVPESWLREALVRTLGEGALVGPDEDCLAWMLPERVADHRILVYHGKRDYSFWIMTTKSAPADCQIMNSQQLDNIKKAHKK